MDELSHWLEENGLVDYRDTFVTNDVRYSDLSNLTEEDVRELGLPLGARRRLLTAIGGLAESSSASRSVATSPDSSAAPRQPPSPLGDAERRQLTVMFCDLVGSTALSASMDPEEYREILAAYQSVASKSVRRYDGYLARHMGDGLLVYFGYPQAHEEDPERAVRASLDIIDAVRALEPRKNTELQVRVGIATGLVVVGDIVGEGASEERAALGDTPNLAARLQSIAEPNTVVLADSTRRLTAGRFEFQALGAQTLKGIPGSVTAYRAVSVRADVSRFAAAHSERLTPFTGRHGELSLLMQYWERAQEGEGQVVVLEGEPGIGKSRLCEALNERIGIQARIVQAFQCSPYHSATPFHPIVEALGREAGFESTDDVNTKLDKLEASVHEVLPDNNGALALIADLLSLPTARYPSVNMTSQRRRAETIAVLAHRLEAMSHPGPLLILFEDAHWSDPSTLEFLDAFVDRLQSLRALALVVARPGFTPRWTEHGHASAHSLNRLGRHAISDMIENLTPNTTLSPEIREAIIGKADGVPLFVEELTKTVIESTTNAATGQMPSRNEPLSPLSIPPTLHDALIARLDRLGAVKEVAQLGACIGRTFSYDLIAAVSPLRSNELDGALFQLMINEIVLRRGEPPDATYTFRHALVRDVAEESLLRSRSQQFHSQIVSALQAGDHEVAPEQLAFHFAKAGSGARAVSYYIEAGKSSLSRSAYREALAHFNAGWEILDTLPDSLERKREALTLHSARAEALTASYGYTVPETVAAYKIAYELCDELGNPSDIFPLLRGIYNNYNGQGRLAASRDVATRCLEFAQRQNDPAPLSLAYRLLGQNEFLMGEFHASREHLLSALDLYDEQIHARSAETYGLDLRSAPLKYIPLLSWLQGYPDQALHKLTENLRHSRELGFPFNEALTKVWAYNLRMLRHEVEAAREMAATLDSLSREYEIPDCVIVAQAQMALADCLLEPGEGRALTRATDCLSAYRDTWGEFVVPFNLGTLAAAYLRCGRLDDALETINGALTGVEDTEERWCEAELWREKGEIHLAISGLAAKEAKDCFLKSLEIAHRQGAKSWELRTSMSLAQFLIAQGDVTGARDLLEPIYAWFTEGFGTADLIEAAAMLAELP